MPKATPKLAAAPSTPPARFSKAPMALPKSSFPTTTLPIESTEATMTVTDHGVPNMREAKAIIVDKRPRTTECR